MFLYAHTGTWIEEHDLTSEDQVLQKSDLESEQKIESEITKAWSYQRGNSKLHVSDTASLKFSKTIPVWTSQTVELYRNLSLIHI